MSEKRVLPGANIFSAEFKKPEEERWNLKADPYTASKRCLEEAKKKPLPLRGTGKLALKVLEWALHSEGEPPFTTEKREKASSQSATVSVKQTLATEQVQQEPVKAAFPRPLLGSLLIGPRIAQENQQVVRGSAARIFPMVDRLLRGPATSSKKTIDEVYELGEKRTSSREHSEVYVEAENEHGKYLRRVAVE